MRLEISKHASCSFHPISAKLHEDIGCYCGIQAITFLGNWPSLTFCGTLKFLHWSEWENPKMSNILKTARRSYCEDSVLVILVGATYVGYFNVWSFEFRLGSFRCTLQNFRCYDLQKATAPTGFIQFQLNFMESLIIKGEYRMELFWRSAKIKKKNAAFWTYRVNHLS